MPPEKGCRYGFEPEDVRQEFAVGALLAERHRPGDRLLAYLRGKVRAARHRAKERNWSRFKIGILDRDKGKYDLQFERALVHEILDLLPYASKERVLKALLSGDGRSIHHAGGLVRRELPNLTKD